MTFVVAAPAVGGLALPPAFTLVDAVGEAGAFAAACVLAPREGAGTFVWSPGTDVLDLAVVLEPDEPLRTARRAFFVGMAAFLDAIGSIAPPDKPLRVDWPATVRFDGARLGGGRLGWPEGCAEDAVPDWLVFSATLIASKDRAGEPGLTPGSTSLAEEGVPPEDGPLLAEAFARHLLRNSVLLREDGFAAAAASYLARLPAEARDAVPSDTAGIAPALLAPSWMDPATGKPLL